MGKKASVLVAWSALAFSTSSAFVRQPMPSLVVSRMHPHSATMQPAAATLSMVAAVTRSGAKRKSARDWAGEEAWNSMLATLSEESTVLAEQAQVRRDRVRCGVCGQIKKGHVCTGPPAMSDVPIQGRARRHHGFDRRLKEPLPKIQEPTVQVVTDVLPTPPRADVRDALQDAGTKMFNSWATDGRDVVMEITNSAAFDEVWRYITNKYPQFSDQMPHDPPGESGLLHRHNGGGGSRCGGGLSTRAVSAGSKFSAIDSGCGNGWAARLLARHPRCGSVTGVDAAALMVDRAVALSQEDQELADCSSSSCRLSFCVADVCNWVPAQQADLVTACESLYFCRDPLEALCNMANWLKPGGVLAATVDCYTENKLSSPWEHHLGVPLHRKSQGEWRELFEAAGLSNVCLWRSTDLKHWWPEKHSLRQGTLLITGEREGSSSSAAKVGPKARNTPANTQTTTLEITCAAPSLAPPPPPDKSLQHLQQSLQNKKQSYTTRNRAATTSVEAQ